MTLVSPKGITVATIVLVFLAELSGIVDAQQMLNLMLLFLLYSLLIASGTIRFSKYFIRENVVKVDGKTESS